MRLAFVTTEFPVSRPSSGGLASYGARMTRLLAEAGHEVEIFVPVDAPRTDLPAEMSWGGCRLHHVVPRRSLASRLVNRALKLAGFDHLAMQRYWMARAKAVAEAVDRRQASAPFDVVHASDSYGIGLKITPRPDRLRIVRCSAAMDLYMACDGRTNPRTRTHVALEEASIAAADFAFAPSRLTAGHYSRKLGRRMAVLPTPIYMDVPALGPLPPGLPPRYLLHFANDLIPRKGTDLVAEALPLALRQAPDLTLVWVGRIEETLRSDLLARMGPAAARVHWLPRQDRPVLYALIRGALCTVLPSRIDNLPNSVLESLMLGTPVIGSRDSSIEELVEDGVTGRLVANGSAPDLAEAMVRAWQEGEDGIRRGADWMDGRIGSAFRPEAALTAYLQAVTEALAGLSRSPGAPSPERPGSGPAAPQAARNRTIAAAETVARSRPLGSSPAPASDADGA